MFQQVFNRIIFKEPCPEEIFLNWISKILSQNISKSLFFTLIEKYIQQFYLSPVSTDSNKQIGFTFWDCDETELNFQFVSGNGFHNEDQNYFFENNFLEDIFGNDLFQIFKATNFIPQIITDFNIIQSNNPKIHSKYKSAILFPICFKEKLKGLLVIYFVFPLSENETKEAAKLLKIESDRLSFFINQINSYFSASFNKSLIQKFDELDNQIVNFNNENFSANLRITVQECINEIINIVQASISTVTVKNEANGKTHFSLNTNLTRFSDHRNKKISKHTVKIPLIIIHDSQLIGIFSFERLSNQSHFSFLERNFIENVCCELAKYLRIYLSVLEGTKNFESELSKQKELLNLCQQISLKLLNSSSSDQIIKELLDGINRGFSFSTLIFLEKLQNKIIPHSSIPESVAESLKTNNVYLEILSKCVLEHDQDWKLDKCLNCKRCEGLTAISALRKTDLTISQTHNFRELYYDFGAASAKSEFIICLSVDNQVYGILDLYRKTSGEIAETEMFFLKSLCNVATLSFHKQHLLAHISQIEGEETRGEMARDIVHTLNPITASQIVYIRLAQDTIKETSDKLGNKDKKDIKILTKKVFEDILNYIEKLQIVVFQLRNLVFRYENISGTKPDVTEIEIKKVIDDVININAYKAREKRINFNHLIGGKPRKLRGVETDFYLILWNLVNNAIKFTKGNRPSKITITEEYTQKSITIEVRDEGVGIREEFRSRIWNLGFSTIAPGQKNETSGIGLATVKELVSQISGADIQVKSIVDRGSIFTLIINQAE